VHAGRSRHPRQVGAVVHEDVRVVLSGQRDQIVGELEQRAGRQMLGA
jgi:hypothetical protein